MCLPFFLALLKMPFNTNDANLKHFELSSNKVHVEWVQSFYAIFKALEADAPRRERCVAALPSLFRGYAREWSDLPGTERYENYRKGIRTDFGILLRR